MNKSHLIAILGACILVAYTPPTRASDLFTYQGKLTNAQGAPLPSGQYRIGIRLWENAAPPAQNPATEAPLWARKYDVPVQNGAFSLMIGATGVVWVHTPAALTESLKLALSSGNRFLDITVMSDSNGAEKPANQWQALTPRQSLNAVPYAMNGVPTGTVVPFAGATAPDGWAICNGDAYNRTDWRYKKLFAAIGTAFGSTSTTFRVPDLRGRAVIGIGAGDTRGNDDPTPATNWTLAQKFGTERHKLKITEMPAHSHGVTDPGHSHQTNGKHNVCTGCSFVALSDDNLGGRRSTRSTTTGITINNEGEDHPHNIIQPILVLNYIIKL